MKRYIVHKKGTDLYWRGQYQSKGWVPLQEAQVFYGRRGVQGSISLPVPFCGPPGPFDREKYNEYRKNLEDYYQEHPWWERFDQLYELVEVVLEKVCTKEKQEDA